MNQNLSYSSYSTDPRGGSGGGGQQQAPSALSFHPTFHPTSTYSSNSAPFGHGASSFIPGSSDYKMPGVATSQPQSSMRLGGNSSESDDRRIAALLDSYFIETPSNAWNQPSGQNLGGGGGGAQSGGQVLSSSSSSYNTAPTTLAVQTKAAAKLMTPEKRDKERIKRLKQAEAARLRYHRLTADQKKELNMKRTLAQKRKRQREKELEELEQILKATNDIQEDPEVTDQLRERRMRAKWAEAARARYQRMTSEERRAHNNKRRMRQMQNAIAATKEQGILTGNDPVKDEEAVRRHIREQNQKKAEAARQRYHRMTDEEKRAYNQRRTEAFRRRRMEEEMLLAMPIGRINGEALDRAQQIVVRNAKRAEAARLRYQRMTPEQRKQYNQKRYTPKRKRMDGMGSSTPSVGGGLDHAMMGLQQSTLIAPKKGQRLQQLAVEEELDALSTLERDVMKRTAQAQQTLARRGTGAGASNSYVLPSSGGSSQGPTAAQAIAGANNSAAGTLASHLGAQLQQQQSQQHNLIHHVQPAPMAANAYNQGIMGHMQPILNPYGARP